MDFPVGDIPFVMAAVFAVVIIFIVYQLKLKPMIEYPLANEEDLGVGKIYLPQLGTFYAGRLTTARNYFAGHMAKAITNSEEAESADLIKLRDSVQKHFLLAQRCGTEKVIYDFDANPLDPRFSIREDKGLGTPIRWISNVQDCGSVGVVHGFKYIWVKLTTGLSPYDNEWRILHDTELKCLSHIRNSAVNLEALHFKDEEIKTLRSQLTQERRLKAEISAERDQAVSALGQQSLSQPEKNKMPGTILPKVKEWFGSPWQIAAAIAAYLVSPIILTAFAGSIPPTSTAYATLAITVAGFFAIPFFKKVFGRWL